MLVRLLAIWWERDFALGYKVGIKILETHGPHVEPVALKRFKFLIHAFGFRWMELLLTSFMTRK
jgi:hypothetical protein